MENRDDQLSSAERQLLYQCLRGMVYCFVLVVGVCIYLLVNYTQPKHQDNNEVVDYFSASSVQDLSTVDLTSVNNGKSLFRNNCGACHARDMQTDLTGPALGGVKERWAKYPPEDLYNWIRNSKAMINAGHPRAMKLSKEWEPTVMNAFPNLKDEEIESILAYIDHVGN